MLLFFRILCYICSKEGEFMETQAEIIRAIQSVASPPLDVIFEIITIFGEELVILPIILFIYWCFNKEMGYWLCWCLSFGNLLVNSIKGVMKVERPIGVEGIRTLRESTATSYSFPSGHTNASANFFTGIARAVNRRRFWIIAFVLPAFVGLSRLYLGVHWPMDVVAGYVIGISVPLLLWFIYRKYAKYKPLLFLISTSLFLPFCAMKGDVDDFWKSLGLGFGLALASFIETKYIHFEIDDVPARKRALRFVLGILLVVAVYYSMKLLLPASNLVAFIRYFTIPVVAAAAWPAIFKKFNF